MNNVGSYQILLDDKLYDPMEKNLMKGANGNWNLYFDLPKSQIGNKHKIEIKISDDTRVFPFENSFWIEITPFVKTSGGGNGKSSRGKGSGNGNLLSGLKIPSLTEVYKDDDNWKRLEFNETDALMIEVNQDGNNDLFVNADNIHLLNEMASNVNNSDKMKAIFLEGMFLQGLSIIMESNQKDDGVEISLENRIKIVSKSMAPILISMVNSFNDS